MQTYKKTTFLQALLLITFLLPGCSSLPGQGSRRAGSQVDDIRSPGFPQGGVPQPINQQQNISMAKRFQEPASQGQTAIESAIELSQKYAKLSEQATVLQRQNQDLIAENSQLKEQVTGLDAKLKQAQKELTEANDLLIEMRIELNNWKADVLGFRDERREAEIAQLEALLKILKILGGEVTSGPASRAGPEPDQANPALVAEVGQPKSQETSNQGNPNE